VRGRLRRAGRCRRHLTREARARRRGDAPQARGKPDRGADSLPGPAVCVPDRARR
jgi:hypothetical protein